MPRPDEAVSVACAEDRPIFVRNCATDQTNGALVAAIIRMGHALGLSVTAEGVETAAQLAHLQQQRCDRAQGSYFSRPIPGPELSRMPVATKCVATKDAGRRSSA